MFTSAGTSPSSFLSPYPGNYLRAWNRLYPETAPLTAEDIVIRGREPNK